MCIPNDDATRNGNKCNNVMKKKRKCLKRKKKNKNRRKWWKSCNNRGKQRNKRWKKTKITPKMKEKNVDFADKYDFIVPGLSLKSCAFFQGPSSLSLDFDWWTSSKISSARSHAEHWWRCSNTRLVCSSISIYIPILYTQIAPNIHTSTTLVLAYVKKDYLCNE